MQTDSTSHLSIPLPHPNNNLEDDIIRLRSAFGQIDSSLFALQTLVYSSDVTLDTVQEIVNVLVHAENDITSITGILATKANVSSLNSHIGDSGNPHFVNKTQVGLSNVENKSSATIRSEITPSDLSTSLGFTPADNAMVTPLQLPSASSVVIANGFITSSSRTISGVVYNSTYTYNPDNSLNVVATTGGGKTRTVTFAYVSGTYSGYNAVWS